MKLIKKILKVAGILILLLLLVSTIYIYTSGPTLPKQTDDIIETVLKNPLPEVVKGKTGFAQSQGLNIWYESRSPKDSSKGAILLIMGISVDALGWTEKFIQAFVDAGYQVIRFDNRGTGMSDWVEKWDNAHPYSLADMADDGVAVLNALGVQKAHIVGVSMGGMIGQELTINHPDRVHSLTSIMSSGYIEDPDLPKISSKVAIDLIASALKYVIVGGEKNHINRSVAGRMILSGHADYELNIKEIARVFL